MLKFHHLAFYVGLFLGASFATHAENLPRYEDPFFSQSKPVLVKGKNLSSVCAESTVSIECSKKEEGLCVKTDLFFTQKGGFRKKVTQPAEMLKEALTATGLACVSGKQGVRVIVEYGGLPSGCSVCEFFYLYDTQGQALTPSHPAFRKVKRGGKPPIEDVEPNNDAFDAQVKREGIGRFETIYFPSAD